LISGEILNVEVLMTPTNPPGDAEGAGRGDQTTSQSGTSTQVDRPWWKHLWIWTATVLAGVASTLLAAWLSGQFDSDAPSKPRLTSEVYVQPFTEEGELRKPFEPSRTSAKGDCWIGSSFSTDPEAWRCGDEKQILDPCWTHGLKAVCPRAPWDSEVVLIQEVTLADRPSPSPKTKSLPWALEVRAPDSEAILRCIWAGGATSMIYGERVNWRCEQDGTAVGDAAGDLSRSETSPWTVLYRPNGLSEARPTDVLTVWY
jgi:hypothetical protein